MAVTNIKIVCIELTVTESTPTPQQMADDVIAILADPEKKMARPGWLISVDSSWVAVSATSRWGPPSNLPTPKFYDGPHNV